MRLPYDAIARARALIGQAAERLPVTVVAKPPVGTGLTAFEDVPCARIPVWDPPRVSE